MIDGLYIYEDFYENVDEVREYALGLDYKISGNYPGVRTTAEDSKQSDYLKSFIEENILHKSITGWDNTSYNTAYQFTTKESKTWIHHDATTWAGILYLTPDAPIESGTSLYRHKDTGISLWDGIDDSPFDLNPSQDCNDMTKWDEIAFVGNLINRAYSGCDKHPTRISTL
jgi:hypothetical protein